MDTEVGLGNDWDQSREEERNYDLSTEQVSDLTQPSWCGVVIKFLGLEKIIEKFFETFRQKILV